VEFDVGADGTIYGFVGGIFSPSKFEDTACWVKLVPKERFETASVFDPESPNEFTVSNYSDDDRLMARVEQIGAGFEWSNFTNTERLMFFDDLTPVPHWYIYNHQTSIDDLPLDIEAFSSLPAQNQAQFARVPRPKKQRGSAFFTIVGYDSVSEDLKIVANVSLEDCSKSCLAEDSCQAFTYDRWNDYCFLKRDLGILKFNSKADSYVLFSAAGRVRRDRSARRLLVLDNRAFANEPTVSMHHSSLTECSAYCDRSDTCLAFQVFESKCEIFDRPDQYEYREGYKLGIYKEP
jgi:hypothetical protein